MSIGTVSKAMMENFWDRQDTKNRKQALNYMNSSRLAASSGINETTLHDDQTVPLTNIVSVATTALGLLATNPKLVQPKYVFVAQKK